MLKLKYKFMKKHTVSRKQYEKALDKRAEMEAIINRYQRQIDEANKGIKELVNSFKGKLCYIKNSSRTSYEQMFFIDDNTIIEFGNNSVRVKEIWACNKTDFFYSTDWGIHMNIFTDGEVKIATDEDIKKMSARFSEWVEQSNILRVG